MGEMINSGKTRGEKVKNIVFSKPDSGLEYFLPLTSLLITRSSNQLSAQRDAYPRNCSVDPRRGSFRRLFAPGDDKSDSRKI